MSKITGLLHNRNFVLSLALILGLVFHQGARLTEQLTIPVLAIVMTVSTMGVPGSIFRSPQALIRPALLGIVMNYLILGGFLLGMNALLIRDEALKSGFVLMAVAPPAVAVIPFTEFFHGNRSLSLMGALGGYLGALIIMPLIAIWFLGATFFDPMKLLMIMLQLILIPLILSRVLLRLGLENRIPPIKGWITNWSFFLVTYTIVGLNQDVFLGRPLTMIPVASIAVTSTFVLGTVLEWIMRASGMDAKSVVSLVLLGTLKNYGVAGGIALTLFSKRTSVPAAVATVFMIIYIIWLGFKKRWAE